MDLRQILLLAIAVLLPLALLAMGRTRLLLGWVCITLFVQVFDTITLTNLPAGRIVGLLYFPFAVMSIRRWFVTTPIKTWVTNFLYLAVLGIAWGFIWPWPDITANRPFSLTAPGRTIVYLGRMLSDVSLTLFVARELCRAGGIPFLRKALIAGSTLSALFGLASIVLSLDFFHVITGLHVDFTSSERARGLSYEPRGLGMACVYGAILLIPYRRPGMGWLMLLVINLLGLVLSGSTSAMALFIGGLFAIGAFSTMRERIVLVGVLGVAAICLSGTALLLSEKFAVIAENVMYRLDPTEKVDGARAESLGERIAYQLDVFDGSALLFLTHEPRYWLSGTGPGLMSLPASYHVPPGVYRAIWTDDVGIDSLPTHGPLLEAANSGLLGLALWLCQMIACWKAIGALAARESVGPANSWKLGRIVFCLGVVFYVVQVSISPVWQVLLAVGWAATMLCSDNHQAQTPRRGSPRFAKQVARRCAMSAARI